MVTLVPGTLEPGEKKQPSPTGPELVWEPESPQSDVLSLRFSLCLIPLLTGSTEITVFIQPVIFFPFLTLTEGILYIVEI